MKHGNILAAIMLVLEAEPTKIWNVDELVKVPSLKKFSKTQISGSIVYVSDTGAAHRHKDNLKHGAGQFALELPVADRLDKSTVMVTNGPTTKKGRRRAKPTVKEIRVAFMEIQNAMTRLEDMVMEIAEGDEQRTKALSKLNEVLSL